MQPHRKIIGNAAWNFLGVLFEVAAGFLTARLLVNQLGETTYGLWIVIGSLATQFLLLDIGIRSSIGRFIALHRGKEDPEAINQILSCGLAVLTVAALLALLITVAALPVLLPLFTVPAEQLESARLALFVLGLNLSAALVLNSFDATLWGFQRFDLTNGIDIPTVVLRTAAIFYFIGAGGGIVSLAVITLVSTSVNGLLKAAMCFYVIPSLRVSTTYWNWSVTREILNYGIWRFVYSISDIVRNQFVPILIGSLLGLAQVTLFSIAGRLTFQVRGVIEAITGVAIPGAAVLHARGELDRQRQLLILGTQCCLAISFYFATLFFLLGESLIVLWIGPDLAAAAVLLCILAAGELLPQSQQVSAGILFASARHRLLAYFNLAEIASLAILMIVLANHAGIIGCCVALAITASLFRGAAVAVQVCRVVDLSLFRYVRQTVPISLLRTTPPAIFLALLTSASVPKAWGSLILYGVLYTAACSIVLLLALPYPYGEMLRWLPWQRKQRSAEIALTEAPVEASCVKPAS
jgi:O-antigen/teichoic acid export membrane protein